MSSSPSLVTPFSTEVVPPQASREPSRFAQVIQRVENCLAAMQKVNDQISTLAEQRRKLHDELRGIQCQVNEEFDRILKPARSVQAGGQAAAATKVVARAVASDTDAKPSLRIDPRHESRLEMLDAAAHAVTRAAS